MYPPKHPSNGTRTIHVTPGAYAPNASECWPGDILCFSDGDTYMLGRDGQTWENVSPPTKHRRKAA